MPHLGDFREAGVIAAAEDLNAPLRVVRGALAAGDSHSLVEVESPQVVVEAIKRAEDSGAVIIRIYEAWGGHCRTRLSTSFPATKAFLCDLLERNREELPIRDGHVVLELAPFKILTLKLTP
jgi:alpha-mannosidase